MTDDITSVCLVQQDMHTDEVPHLPRNRYVHVAKCHACHAKCRCMSTSATPATQNEGRCCQAPRLPRKVPRVTNGDQARHQSQPILTSATPATQSAGGCRQVQRLPHKVPRLPPTRATRASPVSEASRLPRKCSVHVAKCHACHAKCRRMSPSATPAMQSAAAPLATHGAQARHGSQPNVISAAPATKVQVDVAKCHTCRAKCCSGTGDLVCVKDGV